MAKLLLPLIALAASPVNGDWQHWAGPERNFETSVLPVKPWGPDGLPELWRRPIGDGYSGLAVVEGRIFTLFKRDEQDVMVSIDASSGETLWTHAWEAPETGLMGLEFGPGPHSTPLVVGDAAFAIGSTGRLVALSKEDGSPRWTRVLWAELGGTPLERGYAASPIAVLGVDPRTGELLWQQELSNRRYINVASPLLSDGNLLFVVSSEGARVLALEERESVVSPQQLWVANSIGSQVGNVIRFGDYLYGTPGSFDLLVLERGPREERRARLA